MNRQEWLEKRKTGIGGSDCATVLGVSPWKTALELYYEKVGLVEPEDISNKESVKMGNMLEPVVYELFCENNISDDLTSPVRSRIVPYSGDGILFLRHPDYDYMTASPDAMIHYEDGTVEGVEFKTTSFRNADQWADGNVPYHYQLQCQHYMAVTGCKRWHIACLIGGQKYVQTVIERDEELITYIALKEKEFWDAVQNKIPPEWDGSDSAWDIIKGLYPESNADIIDLSTHEDVGELLASYECIKEDIAELDVKKKIMQASLDKIKQELISILGSNEGGKYGDKLIQYKSVTRRESLVKASSYRKFSITNIKEGK